MVGSSGDIGVRQPPYARRSTGGRLRAALQDRRAPCEESAMGTSTRFAVGVHLLTALAASPGKAVRSEDVADSASTNPVVARRLFSLMTAAGLIRARLGPGGGFELARPASDINLRHVFKRWWKAESSSAEHRSPPCRILCCGSPYPSGSARGDGASGRGSRGGAFAHNDCRYRRRRACPKQRRAEQENRDHLEGV